MSLSRQETITQKLQARLAPLVLQVMDESHLHAGHREAGSALGTHWRIRVVSPAFRGMTRVERHRLIYEFLAGEMAAGIHALAIEALTPEEAQ